MSSTTPSFEHLSLALRSLRVRPLFGVTDEEQAFQGRVWATFSQLSTSDDLLRWTASVRHALWGNPGRWEKICHLVSGDVAREGMKRGRLLLGEPVLQFVLDDRWRHDFPFLQSLAPALEEPWTRESLEPVLDAARGLALRFGFRHLRIPAAWSSHRTIQAIGAATAGLEKMTRALAWPDFDLGANRLGLSWGLCHDPALHASYDILNASINISDAGSFAHEWAHALDRGLGEVVDASLRGDSAYLSSQAEAWAGMRGRWDPLPLPGSKEALLAAVSDQLPSPDTESRRLQASHDFLHQLPHVLEALRPELTRPEWGGRLTQRINACGKWVALATSPQPDTVEIRLHWDRWRLGCEVAWSDAATPAEEAWVREFFRMVDGAASIIFGPLANRPAWHLWAGVLDGGHSGAYWSSPHGLWARGLHAVLQSRGAGDWATSRLQEAAQYPHGHEEQRLCGWWTHWLPVLRRIWVSGQVAPTPRSSSGFLSIPPLPAEQEPAPWSEGDAR